VQTSGVSVATSSIQDHAKGQLQMETLSIRLPESLHRNARIYAEQEGVSVSHLITTALAEKLAALGTEDYMAPRAARASEGKFKRSLALVPDAEVDTLEGAA
jgi:hypothetical protein